MPESKTQIVSRHDRQLCWDARDEYFRCLDANKITTVATQDSSTCSEYYTAMAQHCRQTWVEYFIAKRERDLQVLEMKKRVEGMSLEEAQAQAQRGRRPR
ncbi:cytochrome oxidase c subunit VIb-domain-containing protein [Lipomyces arxii]|uniref:cytochrome oxidase c subunit VIb-domain-containing protein n=1 Tax=Lipomyces arxii TaxID=56418 RepID=UPI0034CE7546